VRKSRFLNQSFESGCARLQLYLAVARRRILGTAELDLGSGRMGPDRANEIFNLASARNVRAAFTRQLR
jgi:hypothetical protein